MSARRSILHRFTLWLSRAVLALTIYAASYPFTFYWTQQRFPQAFPVSNVIHAPLVVYMNRPDWFGSAAYSDYGEWVYRALKDSISGDPIGNLILDQSTTAQFSAVPLHEVVESLSNRHGYPMRIDSAVGEIEVTVDSTASLRGVLIEILEPHGLVAWPADERLVIGTPDLVQRVRAIDGVRHPTPAGAWMLLALFCASAASLLFLLRRRRSANQRLKESVE